MLSFHRFVSHYDDGATISDCVRKANNWLADNKEIKIISITTRSNSGMEQSSTWQELFIWYMAQERR